MNVLTSSKTIDIKQRKYSGEWVQVEPQKSLNEASARLEWLRKQNPDAIYRIHETVETVYTL